MIWQRPIHIYVPLDTIRDYLHVDDCARQIAFCVGEWLSPTRNSDDSSAGRIKLFVASQPTSVAQIIGCFAHLASHRQPRVICAPSPLGLQQPRRLFFRSVTPPSFAELPTTPLQLGISAVHQHQLSLFHRGRLSPPPARI
jgi:UDP-glucose 4-epimerase